MGVVVGRCTCWGKGTLQLAEANPQAISSMLWAVAIMGQQVPAEQQMWHLCLTRCWTSSAHGGAVLAGCWGFAQLVGSQSLSTTPPTSPASRSQGVINHTPLPTTRQLLLSCATASWGEFDMRGDETAVVMMQLSLAAIGPDCTQLVSVGVADSW